MFYRDFSRPLKVTRADRALQTPQLTSLPQLRPGEGLNQEMNKHLRSKTASIWCSKAHPSDFKAADQDISGRNFCFERVGEEFLETYGIFFFNPLITYLI